MEGAEFTENIINGVERPVKAAELFAFTLRVRAGNTDVLTDAEENVRQKLRAEGVMLCLKVKNVLALALVVRSRCEVLKASVKALVFGMRSEERFSRNAETDLVCRLLLEKKNDARRHELRRPLRQPGGPRLCRGHEAAGGAGSAD